MFRKFNKVVQSCSRILKMKRKFPLYQVCACSTKFSNATIQDKLIPPILNKYTTIVGVSILSWLGFGDDDENKDSELIMTLKRGILAYNREQYDKAEQLLHIALRIAQQQRNDQGITYCYDLMANVAFEHYKLEKAQKLFVNVLQRLLRSGLSQDDLKVIHISLKLARISHLKGDNETAYTGYNWCLDQIENKRTNNSDARMLYGVIQDWYAQFLLDLGEINKSLTHLKEAYAVCMETKGKHSEQGMLLLNDIGTTTWRAGDLEAAESLLHEAINVGNKLEDKTHLGVIHANLGLIFLQRGIIQMAQKYCKEALNLGNQHKNMESVNQANYCFDQIKISLAK